MRDVIKEQFVAELNVETNLVDRLHVEAVYEAMTPDNPSSAEAGRIEVVRGLLNHRIDVVGIVYHREIGCCKTPGHVLALRMVDGVDALMFVQLAVPQRSDWTGMEEATRGLGIAASVHGLLLMGLIRTLRSRPTAAPAAPIVQIQDRLFELEDNPNLEKQPVVDISKNV